MSLDVYLYATLAESNGAERVGVYSGNITHNLGRMASQAGIYQYVWRPDELNIQKANELIEPLLAAIALLASEPNRFKLLNPDNGWGSYEGLLLFLLEYLEACKRFPYAMVEVSR